MICARDRLLRRNSQDSTAILGVAFVLLVGSILPVVPSRDQSVESSLLHPSPRPRRYVSQVKAGHYYVCAPRRFVKQVM